MGAFYGSVQVRTDDREAVRGILEKLVAKQPTRFLVGPALRGWVGVYPEHHGQDERVAQAVARLFPGEVLYLMVHDDDLFAYAYYRGGQLLDQYNSCPDYFDDDEDGEEAPEPFRGRPEVFRSLLPDVQSLQALTDLLAAEQPLFASETLQSFAEVLAIPNALTSYEYLQHGETDGVEGWDEFIHVPDQAPEKARRQAAEADQAAAKERLRAGGRLLFEKAATGQFALPVWCADREGSGFLVVWASLMARGQAPVERLAPPWAVPLAATGILTSAMTFALARSPSGRYLAAGDGQGKARLWDLDSGRELLEVAQPPRVSWIGFSPDEMHFLAVSPAGMTVTALDGGQRVAAVEVYSAKLAAVHPSGTAVVADETGTLAFVELPSGQIRKKLRAVGTKQSGPVLARLPGEVVQRKVSAAEVEARVKEALERQRAQAEAMQQKVRAAFARAGLPEPKDLRERMAKELAQITEAARPFVERTLAAAGPGGLVPVRALQPAPDQRPERITALDVSADGRWLFYACQEGVRVLRWDELLAAADAAPAPAFAADSEAVPVTMGGGESVEQKHTYTLAHDAAAGRLLFAGLEGTVRSLNLTDGSTSVLLDPPGRAPILRLGLSADRSALCLTCQPELFATGRARKPPVVQVWSYAGLGDRAGSSA
jgi:hypothetical protein